MVTYIALGLLAWFFCSFGLALAVAPLLKRASERL